MMKNKRTNIKAQLVKKMFHPVYRDDQTMSQIQVIVFGQSRLTRS